MNQRFSDGERRDVWRQYLATSAQLVDRLDHELQRYHHLALVDYEILEALCQSPGGRLRMSDLAAQVFVSRSRLTYRIDRLADVGFVVREECEDDRRGMWAIITGAGRESYEAARVSHESAVKAWFFDQMSSEQLHACHEVMRRIEAKLSLDQAGC